MAKKILAIVVCFAFLYSCNSDEKKRPATALDTGRAFIRASLDGDFKTTEELLLKDTQNLELFESYKKLYERMPAENKKNCKGNA